MLNNLMKKILAMFLIIVTFISFISFQLTVFANENIDNIQGKSEENEDSTNSDIVSLYCWDIDDFNLSKLKDEVEYLKINTLYIQRPANDSQSDRLKQIMEFAKQYKLDVFLLEGARDWLTTGDMTKVTGLIDEAYELNQTLDYKFKGVSLDVEFYLTEDYQSGEEDTQKELFKIFTENTKKCCDYANARGLGYSMALPVWLNKLDSEELENLMNYNYDHIAFMNYFKETIMENIDEEVEIARKHNIKIVSIAEVQDPRKGTVGEEDTFYNDGLQECINTLNEIKKKYNYENLGISYHYYKPLLELLERDTNIGIENKYEVQIYPYIDGKSVKADDATISSDELMLKPIQSYYNESEKNVVNFYGLEYGKEYTLTITSGNFTGTETFKYQKNDKNFDKLEIVYMNITLEENKSTGKEPEGTTKPEENKPAEKEPEGTTKPEENKPAEKEPEETTKPEENKPAEKEPEETTKPEENKPAEKEPEETTKPEENKSVEKESVVNKQEKAETEKDNTKAQLILPLTGKNDFIEKIILVFIMVTFGLIIINKIYHTKNK